MDRANGTDGARLGADQEKSQETWYTAWGDAGG